MGRLSHRVKRVEQAMAPRRRHRVIALSEEARRSVRRLIDLWQSDPALHHQDLELLAKVRS